jgi:hypothetical protein|nr:hypothetical protein [uncultured Intestinibacter sp.]DAY85381.1 MAG TPA: hypothetical protein [Caudoviricetes sp.]
MELKPWQQELLSQIEKTDFEENQERICAEFRKLCEPFVGYKDCSFEDNSLRVNNDIYTLQVDINDIIINYSKNGANTIEYKFSLKDNLYDIACNYYVSGELVSGIDVENSVHYGIDYEEILSTLMRLIILGK